MTTDLYRHSPLNRVDMEIWESKFQKFMSPYECKALYDKLFRIMGTLDFFARAGLTFMRDAYVSAKFGNIKNVEKVRLVPNARNENECEVIESGRTYRYNLLKLIELDRKTADEYKNGKSIKFVHVTDQEMTRNFEEGIDRFQKAIEAKSLLITEDRSMLVTYFNVYELEDEKKFIKEVKNVLNTTKHKFYITNVIRLGKVYRFIDNIDECKIFYNRNEVF